MKDNRSDPDPGPGVAIAPVAPPNIHQRMLLTWAVIWPEVMAMSWITASWTTDWPMPLKTLLITGVVVPLAVYVFVPALFGLRVRVLSAYRRRRARVAVAPLGG